MIGSLLKNRISTYGIHIIRVIKNEHTNAPKFNVDRIVFFWLVECNVYIIFKKIEDNSTIANGAHSGYILGTYKTELLSPIHAKWCNNIIGSFFHDE